MQGIHTHLLNPQKGKNKRTSKSASARNAMNTLGGVCSLVVRTMATPTHRLPTSVATPTTLSAAMYAMPVLSNAAEAVNDVPFSGGQ